MPTVITSTISQTVAADYTSLQAWNDAAPSDLVAADQVWRGVILDRADVFTGADATLLNVTGSTVDSTRYKELVAGTGASFADNVGSGALKYDESLGCAIRSNRTFGAVVSVQESYFRISGIQIRCSSNNGRALECGTSGLQIDKSILVGEAGFVASVESSGGKVFNTLFVQQSGGASRIINASGSMDFHNCSFVVPSDLTAATNAINITFSSGGDAQNCAFFGVSGVSSGTGISFTTCYTDVATPPAGCTTTVYIDSFENTLNATQDFRLKAGSALIDSGTDDLVNAATDIFGTTRVAGSFDVGCYEYVVVVTLVPITKIASKYYDDINLGQTLNFKFTTTDADDNPTSLLGNPVVVAYIDDGATGIAAGITLTTDVDSQAGLNNVRVDATVANGFTAGTDIDIVITAGTVGGTSVAGMVVGSFSIENRSAITAAQVRAEVAAALADAGLDHFNELIEDDAGISRFTANSLEQGPSGGGSGDATAANQATIITHLQEIKGTTFDVLTDSLEAARDNHPDNFKDLQIDLGTGYVTVIMNHDKTGYDIESLGGSADSLLRVKEAVDCNVLGTVGSGSTTSSIVTSALDPVGVDTNQFGSKIITFSKDTVTPALRGQSTDIISSTATATPVLTVTALTSAPVDGDTFVIT